MGTLDVGSWAFDAAVLWRRRACKYGFEEGDLLFHDPETGENTLRLTAQRLA